MDTADRSYDVVVVGGGSAGAVLANRLSADPSRTVVLLEAGPVYLPGRAPLVVTDASMIGGDEDHDWNYLARIRGDNPEIPVQRGKVLGGSSAVNAGIALRARRDDIDRWNARGVVGWSFEDVRETFRSLETTDGGDERLHGRSGPFPIRRLAYDDLSPALRGFVDAGARDGLTRLVDAGAGDQHGVGPTPVNVVDGVRVDTGQAYLPESVRARDNLTIVGGAEIDRVLFDGADAVGVLTSMGERYTAGEVILSAGTYGSAAILMRSGIGPRVHLENLGIAVIADLPVGRRVQDHPFFHNVYALSEAGRGMLPTVGALAWFPSASAVGGELDLQISATHVMGEVLAPGVGAIVLASALVRPESVGTVTLRSADPGDAPVIDLDFLATQRDRDRMFEVVMRTRAIAADPIFGVSIDHEVMPGAHLQTEREVREAIDRRLATYGHPTSSAPMGGPGDEWAVVDSMGSVLGVQKLRVIDASIMPDVPSAPTNLTTVMMAEHIAARVFARPSADSSVATSSTH